MADTETSTGRRGRREKTVKVQPEYPDERLGNFIRGLVLGALAGGVGALLNARQRGELTRTQLRARALALRDQAMEATAETRTAVSDLTTSLRGEDVTWSREMPSTETPALAPDLPITDTEAAAAPPPPPPDTGTTTAASPSPESDTQTPPPPPPPRA